MTITKPYDRDVGRPKKRPEDKYRNPRRSYAPQPEKYARIQERARAEGITVTDVINWGFDKYLDGKMSSDELDRLRKKGKR